MRGEERQSEGAVKANRVIDWLNQAKGDLGNSKNAGTVGDYDWACFAAQQSAERAVKGLRLSKGGKRN